jgi:hypothetical protein
MFEIPRSLLSNYSLLLQFGTALANTSLKASTGIKNKAFGSQEATGVFARITSVCSVRAARQRRTQVAT